MKSPVARLSRECGQCQKVFKPGEEVASRISLGKEGDFWDRKDYCVECLPDPDDKDLATWKVKIPEKGEAVFSEDAIWQIMKKASEDSDLASKPLTYILCLLLARKRKLRVLSTRRLKAREMITYSNKSKGVEVEVVVPDLNERAFGHLQRELGDFLKESA